MIRVDHAWPRSSSWREAKSCPGRNPIYDYDIAIVLQLQERT